MSGNLGIYFGAKVIAIVETKGRKIASSIKIPLSAIYSSGLEEKVPDDIKIVAICKDELRKNGMNIKTACVGLSGKDLIIRTFEVPSLPRNELANAVNFEARKYIPFKIEDLFYDFQIQFDSAAKKNRVLFIGIKRETFNKYLSILSQLGIEPRAIEYSGFSTLRLLKLAGVRTKGVVGVVNLDFNEDDEVNFTVLEEGFPLFSRDISLAAGPMGVPEESVPQEVIMEKLKTEIRISLDYYERTYHSKAITHIFIISGQERREELEVLIKEIGFSVQTIDINKIIGKTEVPFSLSLLKSYSVSLAKTIGINLKASLLAARARTKTEKARTIGVEKMPLLANLKVYPQVLALAVLICAATFVLGYFRIQPLKKELQDTIANRPKGQASMANAGYDELIRTEKDYKNEVEILENLLKKQMYFTELLDVLPKIASDNMFFEEFSVQKDNRKTEFELAGRVDLPDNDSEFQAVNNLLANLKRNQLFSRYFEKIAIDNLKRETDDKTKTSFATFSVSGVTERKVK